MAISNTQLHFLVASVTLSLSVVLFRLVFLSWCCCSVFQGLTYSGSQVMLPALLPFILFPSLTCPIHTSSSFLTLTGWRTVVASWNWGRRGDKVGQWLSSVAQSAGLDTSSQHYVMLFLPADIAVRLDSPHASPRPQTSNKQFLNHPDKRHRVENRKWCEINWSQELFMLC